MRRNFFLLSLGILWTSLLNGISGQDCILKVNKDFPSNLNQPLYINPAKALKNTIYDITNYWLPQTGDTVKIKSGEQILIVCPNVNNNIKELPLKPSQLLLTCDNTMLVDEFKTPYQLIGLTCKCQRSKPDVKIINQIDADDSPLCKTFTRAKIGFELSPGNFYETMEVRFNLGTKSPVYSKHLLTPEIIGVQTGRPNPDFLSAINLYGNDKKVKSLYTNQKTSLEQQIGPPVNGILSKGHFAPSSDFVYRAVQVSTFMYENSAPQWKELNGNNWCVLENSCRQFVININRPVEVYTGVTGNLQLENKTTRKLQNVFLENTVPPIDPINDLKIKIPNFFWKILYDRQNQKGVAFAMVNNPFEVNRDKTGIDDLCTDICNTGDLSPKWNLNWKNQDYKYGYGICCAVDDIAKKIPEIPKLDVSKGILNQ